MAKLVNKRTTTTTTVTEEVELIPATPGEEMNHRYPAEDPPERKVHRGCPAAEDRHHGFPDKEAGREQGHRAAVLCGGQSRGDHSEGTLHDGARGDGPKSQPGDGHRKAPDLQREVRTVEHRLLRSLRGRLPADPLERARQKENSLALRIAPAQKGSGY